MKIGYAEISIAPLCAAQTAGYFIEKEPATYVRDGLFARALIMDDTLLLCLDSLGVSGAESEILRAAACKAAGVKNVILSATHTHLAPSLMELYGLLHVERDYFTLVKEAIVKLCARCGSERREIRVGLSQSPFSDVGRCRISRNNSENVRASALCFYEGSALIGALLLYNCHPTIPEETADYFTADYPGYVVFEMQRRFPNAFFMFLQGCCGDVSTRFTRREKSYAEVERLGEILCSRFDSLVRETLPVCPAEIWYAERRFTVKNRVKPLPRLPEGIASKLMRPKELREYRLGLEFVDYMRRSGSGSLSEALISRLSVGDFRIVFTPWELFSYYNSIADKSTLIACYSQGFMSYLTPPRCHTLSYEYLLEMQTARDKKNIIKIIKSI